MTDVLMFALNLAWKVLALAFGWMLFKYVIRNGKGAFHDLLTTIELSVQAGCALLRRKLVQKIEKEVTEEDPDGPEKAEGTVV